VIGNGVVERGPGDGSWVSKSDLLLSGFKKLNPPKWGLQVYDFGDMQPVTVHGKA
jgi:hypothetical protein